MESVGVETVKYKEFGSRREINKYLREMGGFLEKKADFRVTNQKGANLQYSEVQEAERMVGRVNKQKKEQWDKFKDLPYKHRGVPTGWTVEQQADPDIGMGDPKYANFKPVKYNIGRFRTEKEFRDWVKDKERVYDRDWLTRQNELYRENYIKSMVNNLGNASEHLQKHIRNMPMDDFIKEYYSENNAHINFVYDHLAVKARVKELETVWNYQPPEE